MKFFLLTKVIEKAESCFESPKTEVVGVYFTKEKAEAVLANMRTEYFDTAQKKGITVAQAEGLMDMPTIFGEFIIEELEQSEEP